MKSILKFLKTRLPGRKAQATSRKREELEKKVVEGAKRAVKDYGRVFERLAEYDRT